jgi:hypothetical protein
MANVYEPAFGAARDEPVRVLIVSTMLAPEINEFPETGRVWIRDYAPGSEAPPGALDRFLQPEEG